MKELSEKAPKRAMIAYVVIWAVCFATILLSPHDDGGIAFITMYIVLPITALCVSAVIGYVSQNKSKWLTALLFGVMNLLCAAAFPILNSGFNVKEIVTYYDFADLPMLIFFTTAALFGLLFGHIKMRHEKRKANK
ncbi:MAG: hypothetical protein IJI47_04950 [Eubacterium sp.]|nr:hypothetical protein [Eubacterium sp.]